MENKELLKIINVAISLRNNPDLLLENTRVIINIAQEIIDKTNTDDLWDENSEYVGDSLFDLEQVANTNIMKKSDFIKMFKTLGYE
jgi:hypothetical protein